MARCCSALHRGHRQHRQLACPRESRPDLPRVAPWPPASRALAPRESGSAVRARARPGRASGRAPGPERVGEGVQGVPAGPHRHAAGRRERDELAKVVERPDGVADHADLGQDQRERRHPQLPAVPDDEVGATRPHHRQRGADGVALAHEVDHGVGARPVGEVADGVDLAAVDREGVVGAGLGRQGAGLRIGVDGDDRGRGQGAQALDADVAEPADADDRDRGPGPEQGYGLAGDVHRGEPGVGVRGEVDGVEARRQREHAALGGEQQVGEPAGPGQTGEGEAAGAAHVVADAAGRARAAALLGVADHDVARRDLPDLRPDRLDHAGVLVAEDEGKVRRHGRGEPAVADVQVGPAEPGAGDPDEHVVRAGGLRLRHLVELR
jgi:hypothetical protein